jgi:cell division protein FtsA
MKQPLLIGLDIGSSRIRLAMGQLVESADQALSLSIVGAVEVPSQGISKGVVSALEDAVTCISAGIEQAERQSGSPVEEAVVGINGVHIGVMEAKGVVGVSRPDREIRPEDIERAMEDAKSVANPANVEILHVLPHDFIVDGQTGIRDPLGMHGIRIEAHAHLVTGLAGNVRNMTKCVFRTGLDIASLVFSPLAAAHVVTSYRERELGVCVVVIGASTTSVIVFEDGELLHAKVLPIGGDHVTSDIAIGLRTSLDIAEQIKLLHGNSNPDAFGKRDEIDLQSLGGGSDGELISLRYVAEIIQARMEELFEKVEEELRAIGRSGMLPAGVVLTGGGAKLGGSVETAKSVLRLPAALASATHLHTTMPEYAHDPSFSTAVGLVQWGFDEIRKGEEHSSSGSFLKSGGKLAGKITGSIKKMFGSFIP